jgi:hypothetical protein
MRPLLQTPMGISARLRGCLMGADTNQPEVSALVPGPVGLAVIAVALLVIAVEAVRLLLE